MGVYLQHLQSEQVCMQMTPLGSVQNSTQFAANTESGGEHNRPAQIKLYRNQMDQQEQNLMMQTCLQKHLSVPEEKKKRERKRAITEFDAIIYFAAAVNTECLSQSFCQFGPPAANTLKAAKPLNCDQFCLCRWRRARMPLYISKAPHTFKHVERMESHSAQITIRHD